uniref:peptidoglycan D,D-transpeptidase FtsI family protein n=1 Tax=Acetatifactor sp. TaxID=1872090 RepID=UPI0040574554
MKEQKQKEQKVKKFTVKMQKKLVVLFMIVLLAFAGLGVRLIWITREDGTEYSKQVLSQQRYDSTTIPFRRGDIVDAKGTKLAVSEKVYNLVVDANVMLDKEVYLEPTLQALGNCFPELDMTAVREYVVTHPNSSWYVPLRRLSYEEIADFQVAQLEDKNIKGIWFEEEYKRVYPNGSLAADVIGFARTDNQGMYGLEEYYNDMLNGTPGREYGYLNDDSTLERTIKPAVDGNTIHSTIDANIQSIVEKYLKAFNEENKNGYRQGNGAENVGCIIMEVNTGKILAMASYPTYDLNDTRNTDALLGSTMVEQVDLENGYYKINKTKTVITEDVLSAMTEEQVLLQLNQLWKNYCITDTYEPGSTAKPFTVAAALEQGVINEDTHYQCDGAMEVGGYTIKCHSYAKGGDGYVSLQDSIAWSCNVAMMKIGQDMGKEQFSEFQSVFNFGLKTNVDLAGEARTASLIYPMEKMGPTDLATNTFGQNFNVTMIQMITGFCSLINGGYYYEPHMVDKITNASGATVENIEPRVLKQTVSESTSALIRQYCRAVVMEEGGQSRTGRTARPAGYAIGGKTGTAETIDPVTNQRSDEEYVVSFMGYAPADDPEIAIYVVVDRPNTEKQDNAQFATKLVRNILTEVLPYLQIFMTEELSEDEIAELEERQLEITNMYAPAPEEGSENAEGSSEQEGNGEGGDSNGDNEEEENTQPDWRSYAVDPVTGNYVHPTTGEQLDPETGYPVGNFGSMGNVPANPNLIDQ